jgi:putative alpha-1,2-mannosidase
MSLAKPHYQKIFSILLLLLLCFPGAMAIQYISFAQPDTLTQKDIYLYNASGSLLGLYNTTSTGIEIPAAGDIMFVIKPQYSTPLDEPGTWLSATFSYVSSNLAAIIIILFLIGVLLARK